MGKELQIEKLAQLLHGNACSGNCNSKSCCCNDFLTAERLVIRGYGNLKEFAERLCTKLKHIYCLEDSWKITSHINELLKEYTE